MEVNGSTISRISLHSLTWWTTQAPAIRSVCLQTSIRLPRPLFILPGLPEPLPCKACRMDVRMCSKAVQMSMVVLPLIQRAPTLKFLTSGMTTRSPNVRLPGRVYRPERGHTIILHRMPVGLRMLAQARVLARQLSGRRSSILMAAWSSALSVTSLTIRKAIC